MLSGLWRSIGGRVLTGQLRAAAEGKLGPLPQRLILFGQCHMTETSFLVGCLLVPVLLATGNGAVAAWVGVLAGAGVSVGLVRKSWKEEVPPEVLASGWYRFLRDHAADVASTFALAAAAVQTCDPETVSLLARAHLTCDGASLILVVIAAVWAHLGLSASARLAPPPLVGAPNGRAAR